MTYDSKNEFKKYFVKIANSNYYINKNFNSQMGKLFFFFGFWDHLGRLKCEKRLRIQNLHKKMK